MCDTTRKGGIFIPVQSNCSSRSNLKSDSKEEETMAPNRSLPHYLKDNAREHSDIGWDSTTNPSRGGLLFSFSFPCSVSIGCFSD